MTPNISFKLPFITFYLLISFHLTQSHLPPSPSPSPQPKAKKVSSPSPSPSTRVPVSSVSFPPSTSQSPSPSPSEPPSGSISSDIIENYSEESEPISSDDESEDSSDTDTDTPELSEEDPHDLIGTLISSLDPNEILKEVTANTDGKPNGPLDLDFSRILSSTEVDPKVKEICDSTDYPTLCLSTVIPLLKGKADTSSVLEVLMSAGSKFAEYALSETKKYVASPDTSPRVKSIITNCIDSYDTILYNFQTAMGAFPEKDIGTIGSVLSAVITGVGDCEDAFQEIGEKSPFSGFADKMFNMTSNCLAVVALMRDN